VDICAVLTEENVEKLRWALKEWNPTLRMIPEKPSLLLHPPAGRPADHLHLQTDMGMVDI
jgi:hypothetical protein